MVLYFIATVFLSATLLFSVQPMVAKSLLPVFGGSSSVWTTCMLFYQTVLLLGYLYAHFVMKRVPRKVQLVGHVAMLVVALVAGVLYDTPTPPPEASTFPVPWLILQLLLVSGLPFFMISSAGPLVQGWFARTGHARAHDPYFLYAASNAGSLIGLLAYPFVIEPMIGLDTQRMVWLGGFGLFVVLSAGAIMMTRSGSGEGSKEDESTENDSISWKRRLRWMFYAFVPSTMLLGVTSHISMDIASFPMLWVLPLAVYLVTMIIAFAVNAERLVDSMRKPVVAALIGAGVLVAIRIQSIASIEAVIAVQMILLTTVGLLGHGMLSADRPRVSHLTEFYLVMSIGGALGGFFNGIVAPLVFQTTWEYQIALLCAAALLPWRTISTISEPKDRKRAKLVRYALPFVSLVLVVLSGMMASQLIRAVGLMEWTPIIIFVLMVLIPMLLLILSWRDGLASVLLLLVPVGVSAIEEFADPNTLYRERTFYGVLSVVDKGYVDPVTLEWTVIRSLQHGTTDHGIEVIDPDRIGPAVPQGYYNPMGPCGMTVRAVQGMRPLGMRVGAVGLGTGAVAAFNRETDLINYFEIDPGVADIAQDPEYFSYLTDAQGELSVELGDGRLLLEQERTRGEEPYDLLIIDAFSSDSIPVHLLTQEAVGLYFDRITDDGVVLIHISNRHLNLHPLVFRLGDAHESIVLYRDQLMSEIDENQRQYWLPSTWMALTKNRETAVALSRAGMQVMEQPEFDVRIWTDQYSNILPLFE
ncbi:MAG: fused MFS/spermidine synthase [Phycisphaerales bacterium]|nr:fused MFS/spermidine synthase [Phycisphaerales bacterium]